MKRSDDDLAKLKLENQLKITKDYKGNTIVIPGNHDWYHGLDGLKAQEKAVTKYLNDKKAFLPKKVALEDKKALGDFNYDYGDELYMIEERFSDSPDDLKMLNGATTTMNTLDMMKNLQKSEKYSVDQQSYIRARIFDMLIGDWGQPLRHGAGASTKNGNSFVYKAIPKDRIRHSRAYPLDLAFLKNATEEDWKKEAEYIKQNMTDEVIDNAFHNLPKEVQTAP
ncbi:hypothetical protein FQR65_LT15091 [Abscondita terminalis]|nr:hypothetical protein FQR65_LT15091 [Abscondita terminalis]